MGSWHLSLNPAPLPCAKNESDKFREEKGKCVWQENDKRIVMETICSPKFGFKTEIYPTET